MGTAVEITSVKLLSGRGGVNVLLFTVEFTWTGSGSALVLTAAF